MTDRWMDRLSDYLDDDLAPAERVECEAHLASCVACRAVLDDLRALVAEAATLPVTPPATDLWAGIAARIEAPPVRLHQGGTGASRPRGGWRFSLPQLLAAGLAFALMGGAGTAYLLRDGTPAPASVPTAGVGTVTPVASAPGEATWVRAVGELQAALDQGRDRLDPRTIRTLEASLATIDRAIAEARQALAADPANPYLNRHLQDTMRRKLDVLRQAATIVSQS